MSIHTVGMCGPISAAHKVSNHSMTRLTPKIRSHVIFYEYKHSS